MKAELQKKLHDEFPTLYVGLDSERSLMRFGFMCGDGWYDILHELSEQVLKADPSARACQVKEKFGGLRVYISSSSHEVLDLALAAEKKSFGVCENCGKPSNREFRRLDDWYWTVCSKECKEQLRGG